MTSKSPTAQLKLGTCIDGGALELVEVLGVGGYGVVYRAVETCSFNPQSYAVKCLMHGHDQSSTRRQTHIREIALHQLSSAHHGVVTLHRVIEDSAYTYIILDFAPDHDLFTQILNNCRYLGNDALIKHIFLQLIDAVDYCHSLGIYHRDLKPENILCFDNGSRVAITDFGLATTEKVSGEMRTGSIYHMSPECQGDEFSTGAYSPMFNDVWSLGIILLNLTTGRNPWKTATLSDETFCEYLRNPSHFFSSVLPISPEVNQILLRMLHVDWTERTTLSELRQDLEDIESFYIPDVVFDGSQARCPWESVQPVEEQPQQCVRPDDVLKSHWSEDSQLGYGTAVVEDSKWTGSFRGFLLRAFDSEPDEDLNVTVDLPSPQRSSNSSSCSDPPSTPDNTDISFANCYPVPRLVDDSSDRRRFDEKNRLPTSSQSSSVVDMESRCSGVSPLFDDSPSSSLFTSKALHGHSDFGLGRLPSSGLRSSSGVRREITFIRSMTPSSDLFPWANETPAAPQFVYPLCELKGSKPITLNPIKLFSHQPIHGPTSTQQKRDLVAGLPPDKLQTAHNNSQRPRGKGGHQDRNTGAFREVQTNDSSHRKPLSPLGSVKHWFSPSKLFF